VSSRHPLLLPYAALLSVCFFWGTTYLAIRMALETFPPLLLVGARFTASGLLLLIGAWAAGLPGPSRRDLLYSALYGFLALGLGNGCLTYAELWIPSSLAALLVTTSPFWMVLMEAASPNGEPLRWPTVAGMLVGLAGTALLVGPDAWREGFSGNVVKGFLVLQAGCLAWGFASVAQRRRIPHLHAIVSGGLQQLAAGLAFLAPAIATGDRLESWDARGIGAAAYLVVFGSIVGYTSYVYALKKLSVAVVTLHTYINPVVAAVLGWLFYREPFGWRETLAMLVIFAGVALVKGTASARPGPAQRARLTPSRGPSPPSPRPTSARG